MDKTTLEEVLRLRKKSQKASAKYVAALYELKRQCPHVNRIWVASGVWGDKFDYDAYWNDEVYYCLDCDTDSRWPYVKDGIPLTRPDSPAVQYWQFPKIVATSPLKESND